MKARVPKRLTGQVSLLVLTTLFVLLGIWQVRREVWKAGLLSDIARAERGPPMDLDDDAAPLTKVQLTGSFAPGRPIRLGAEARQDGSEVVTGSDVVRALIRPGRRPVLVDLGWAPDGDLPASPGARTVIGYVLEAQLPGPFAAAPDLSRRWFPNIDPDAIGMALGQPDVLPLIVVVYGKPGNRFDPVPTPSIPRPPDNHVAYAITWFGLAACTIALLTKFRGE